MPKPLPAETQSFLTQYRERALAQPYRPSEPWPSLGIILFLLGTRRIYATLTVDVEWPEGAAWHLVLSRQPIERCPLSLDMEDWDPHSDPELAALIDAVLDPAGAGRYECFVMTPGGGVHALRHLSAFEIGLLPRTKGASHAEEN